MPEPPIRVIGLEPEAVIAHRAETERSGAPHTSMRLHIMVGDDARTIRVHLESATWDHRGVTSIAGYITTPTPRLLVRRLLGGRFSSELHPQLGLCLVRAS